MRRYLIAGAAVAAMLCAALPSRALPPGYVVDYGAARGVAGSFSLAGGGRATAWLTELDTVAFEGEGTTKPNPAQSHSFLGCITVTTKVGSDSGCRVLKGAAISLDPSLSTVTASWSVDSKMFPKQEPPVRILASLIFTGTGAYALKSTPTITPETNDSTIDVLTVKGGPSVARPAAAIGFVKAEARVNGRAIGGGAITSSPNTSTWIGTGGSIFLYCQGLPPAAPQKCPPAPEE